MPSTADESTQFKLNLFLVDLRPRAAEQIVSNVLELPIAIVQGRFGLFCQKVGLKVLRSEKFHNNLVSGQTHFCSFKL